MCSIFVNLFSVVLFAHVILCKYCEDTVPVLIKFFRLVCSALVEQLNTHVGIYSALEASVRGGDRFPESEVDRHVARLFLQDFHQCGIHLDEASRQQVVGLTDRILRTGQQFAAGCHAPRVVNASVLPSQIRGHFQTDGDRVIVSGKLPVPVLIFMRGAFITGSVLQCHFQGVRIIKTHSL